MNGWEPSVAIVKSKSIEDVLSFFENEEFILKTQDKNHAVLYKEGTSLTFKSDKCPLFLLIIREDNYIKLHLRYAALVFFDTGDLDKLLEKYINKLG